MSELRHQLRLARTAHLLARYHGDLAVAMPPALEALDWRRWMAGRWKPAALLATAAGLAVMLSLPPTATDNADALLPSLIAGRELPSLKQVIAGEDLLAAVEEPVKFSEDLMVAIGKDIADQAKALLGTS